MILEHLVDLIVQLRCPRPKPLVIWFVDRPATYYNLMKQRHPQYEVQYDSNEFRLLGIPVRRFSPSNATQEELDNRPDFCAFSGVWVEMSDGKHLRLADEYGT